MDYDAILFDFDGVLVDSEPLHCECWSEVLAPFGIRLDWPTYRAEFIGETDRMLVDVLCSRHTPPLDPDAVWLQYPRKKVLFAERMSLQPPFAHGIISLLRALSAEYKLAVVTSSGRSEVEPVLVRAGIRELFDAAVFGSDVPRLKPAPDPYLKAVAALGARRPLAVEDSRAGVASARAAGCDVVEVDRPARVVELVMRKLERNSNKTP